jgi:GTP-binding protein
MSLIDDVHITVIAGNGGHGATATKQLFGTKKTAPDGGNGGNGGNIYFIGDNNISDLSEFKFKKKIKAPDGVNGGNKDLDGANAPHMYVKVPFGTLITDVKTGHYVEILSDLPFCVAYGGHGGMGNHDYKPDLRKMTYRYQEGEKGDNRELHLVLNLIADIGLVGYPNAGKSSLLKTLTNAVPKIGDYAFTTLEPNLGAMGKTIIADIPGLIEGASEGKGLGIQFLKHIKKTKVLLHCVSVEEDDVVASYESVRSEFKKYDASLLTKKEIVLLTKTDLADKEQIAEKIKELQKVNSHVIDVSIYNEGSINTLKEKIEKLV